jgi:LysR family hydrogen peroxide-inducible transcriptional activator
MAFPHAVNGLETMVLFEDVYHFVCHADHPLATAETVDVEDLPQLDLLLLEKDHCLHAHAIPLLTAAAGATRSSFSATSLHTLVAMVGEGQGAILGPTIAIKAGLHEAHSSVVVPIAGQTQAPCYAVHRITSIMQRAGFCGVLVAEACFSRCLRWILLRIIPEPSVPLR